MSSPSQCGLSYWLGLSCWVGQNSCCWVGQNSCCWVGQNSCCSVGQDSWVGDFFWNRQGSWNRQVLSELLSWWLCFSVPARCRSWFGPDTFGQLGTSIGWEGGGKGRWWGSDSSSGGCFSTTWILNRNYTKIFYRRSYRCRYLLTKSFKAHWNCFKVCFL